MKNNDYYWRGHLIKYVILINLTYHSHFLTAILSQNHIVSACKSLCTYRFQLIVPVIVIPFVLGTF